MALAYFITFTTYGTWLPGSSKGFGSVDKEHSAFGTPFVEPDTERERAAREAMDQLPYIMSPPERDIVCHAIVQLARDRNWQLLAVHVRTNHVHAVVRADCDPSRIMSDIKARASRDLTRAGFDNVERKRWTRHGSTKHLFHEHEVADKIDYTLHRQGEPMATFDGTNEPQNEPRTQ